MRTSEDGIILTEKNRHIRMCIAETLIELLEKKELDQIKITELVKRASVSRMTFYKYYKSKLEVLNDYMYELVNEYMEDSKKRTDIGGFHEYEHICHCFYFFQRFSHNIQILIKADLYSIIINALNNYMDEYVLPNYQRTKYDLYYYAGALCNTYIQWIEFGMKESPEYISSIVYKHLSLS
ncbi:MAG: TetR/AcrR family transcriptional regulator [bacterium]|nr:TetR/AcrR family transcriptional regulator [bacterium]